jgi:hypothetical protein
MPLSKPGGWAAAWGDAGASAASDGSAGTASRTASANQHLRDFPAMPDIIQTSCGIIPENMARFDAALHPWLTASLLVYRLP